MKIVAVAVLLATMSGDLLSKFELSSLGCRCWSVQGHATTFHQIFILRRLRNLHKSHYRSTNRHESIPSEPSYRVQLLKTTTQRIDSRAQ